MKIFRDCSKLFLIFFVGFLFISLGSLQSLEAKKSKLVGKHLLASLASLDKMETQKQELTDGWYWVSVPYLEPNYLIQKFNPKEYNPKKYYLHRTDSGSVYLQRKRTRSAKWYVKKVYNNVYYIQNFEHGPGIMRLKVFDRNVIQMSSLEGTAEQWELKYIPKTNNKYQLYTQREDLLGNYLGVIIGNTTFPFYLNDQKIGFNFCEFAFTPIPD